MFILVLFKTAKCPSTNECMKKIWYMYTMKYYSAAKKNAFCHLQQNGWNWRTLCQVNQPDTESQILHVLPHMWKVVQ